MNCDVKNHYELCIESDLNKLQMVEEFTEKILRQTSFSDDDIDSIAISITEIISNAILHGNKGDKNKKVDISFQLESDAIIISVKDEGPGFDINNIDNPIEPQNLLKDSGRGVFIVKALMDKIEFEAKNNGLTVIMMKKIKNK
jgi:serine/threonine-protein kinase RsbW